MFLFFVIGLIFMFIFNSIMSYIIAQRSEYNYNYERYNLLAGQTNTIVNELKSIDMNLFSNKTLDVNELIEVLNQKKNTLKSCLECIKR
ncbi:Hypothetical protein BHY_0381 [Borrelia nietonii YOR]|uniref:Uncharacterized protein n=1 Tax=Borrelia nietonii YOR TaxID=1293576 RepID=A0ABM5PGW1_9SPIR|nr:Hypothetical protein BHY_0381 [Borrelia nietonii YOR]